MMTKKLLCAALISVWSWNVWSSSQIYLSQPAESIKKCFASPKGFDSSCQLMMTELARVCTPGAQQPSCQALEKELTSIQPAQCFNAHNEMSSVCRIHLDRLGRRCFNNQTDPLCISYHQYRNNQSDDIQAVAKRLQDRAQENCGTPAQCLAAACNRAHQPTSTKIDFIHCAEYQKFVVANQGAQLSPWTRVTQAGVSLEVIDTGCFTPLKSSVGATEMNLPLHVFLKKLPGGIAVHHQNLTGQFFPDIRTAIDKGCEVAVKNPPPTKAQATQPQAEKPAPPPLTPQNQKTEQLNKIGESTDVRTCFEKHLDPSCNIGSIHALMNLCEPGNQHSVCRTLEKELSAVPPTQCFNKEATENKSAKGAICQLHMQRLLMRCDGPTDALCIAYQKFLDGGPGK